LINYLKKSFNSEFVLTDKAKELLLNYSWKGNVRELRNCVEYIVNLGVKVVDEKDIPFDYSEQNFDNRLISAEQNIIFEFLEQVGNNLKKYIFVLEELVKGNKNNQRLGRRTLSEIAKNKDVFISEQEIRTILLNLEKYKMAEIYKGRSGTVITEFGKK